MRRPRLGYLYPLLGHLAPCITVNCIIPGLDMHEGLRGAIPDKFFESLEKDVPMKRAGKPEEIAEAAAFFLSAGASYVIRQTMHVTGGLSMSG